MFAPPVAKAQTKVTGSSTSKLAPHRSTLAARPFGGGAVEQAHMLQRSIGNQAVQRLSLRATSLTGNNPHSHNEEKAAPANLTARGATLGVAWDFSKIPAFPPDRRSRPQAQSRLVAPPVSGAISRKLFVGQPSERLEHD